MSSIPYNTISAIPVVAILGDVADQRMLNRGDHSCGLQRLPTDPIGTINGTFDGVPASSEIRVYRADGVELAGVESCASSNPSLSWPVYAPGANAVNRIVIINLAYVIKEFNYTPSVGTVSIPIQMDDDDWYSNPV